MPLAEWHSATNTMAVLSSQCVVHRKRKRMLDESWVISYSDIKISEMTTSPSASA